MKKDIKVDYKDLPADQRISICSILRKNKIATAKRGKINLVTQEHLKKALRNVLNIKPKNKREKVRKFQRARNILNWIRVFDGEKRISRKTGEMSRASLFFGFSDCHFAVIKNQSPKVFKYIEDLGKGNLITGYALYKKEGENLLNEVRDIVTELYNNSKKGFSIYNFSRYLHKKGIYGHWGSFQTHTQNIFAEREEILYFEIRPRYGKIIKAFEKYKILGNRE